MINQEQALELKEQFAKLCIPFNVEQFDLALQQVKMDNVDIEKIIQKVQDVVKIVTQSVNDDDATRDAYFLLNHFYDVETINCFANNTSYFGRITKQFERVRWCLNAALIGSIEVAESLFDDTIINPKDNTYILSFAIYSGNSTWVKQLVEKWHVDIRNPEYCFKLYAERAKQKELVDYFVSKSTISEEQALKFYETKPSSSSSFFKEKKSVSKQEKQIIKQKLLESFAEIILGELEELIELKDNEAKDLLINILKDPNKNIEEVVKFASELDPVLSKRFAIIYCCMNKEKWEDTLMKKYYKPLLIDKYIEFFYPHEEKSNKELMSIWLKNYAKSILDSIFLERNINIKNPLELSESEKIKKNKILKNLSALHLSDEALLEDSKLLEDEINIINDLIDKEGSTGIACNLLTSKSVFKNKYNKTLGVILSDIKDLVTDDQWKEIYSLIEKTAQGASRPENKMRNIVFAIIYKEKTGCRWKDLPQWMPKETTVRHYFYEWVNNDIMKDIISIINSKYSESKLIP